MKIGLGCEMPKIFTDAGLAEARHFLVNCVDLLHDYASGPLGESLEQRLARAINPGFVSHAVPVASDAIAGAGTATAADNKIHLLRGNTIDLPARDPAIRIDITEDMWRNPSVQVLVQAIYWMNHVVARNDNEIFNTESEAFKADAALVAEEGFKADFFLFRGLMDGGVENFAPVVSDRLSLQYNASIIDFLQRIDVNAHINKEVFSGLLPVSGGMLRAGIKIAGVFTGRDYYADLLHSAMDSMRLNATVFEPSMVLTERTENSTRFIKTVKHAFFALEGCANKPVISGDDLAYLKKYCVPIATDVIDGRNCITPVDLAEIARRYFVWVNENSVEHVTGLHHPQILDQVSLFMTSVASGGAMPSCIRGDDYPSYPKFKKAHIEIEAQWLELMQKQEALCAMLQPTGVALGPTMREQMCVHYDIERAKARADGVQEMIPHLMASFAHSVEMKSAGLFSSEKVFKHDPVKGALAQRICYALSALQREPSSNAALTYAYATLLNAQRGLNHLLGRSGPYRDASRNTFSTFGRALADAIDAMTPYMLDMNAETDAELQMRLAELPVGHADPIAWPVVAVEPVDAPATPQTPQTPATPVSASPSPVVEALSKLAVTTRCGGVVPAVAGAEDEDAAKGFVMVSPAVAT